MTRITVLRAGDEAVLDTVAPDVFDHPLQPHLVTEFLSDPRHHIAVALEEGLVVGFASAVHYLHPDKPPELWINEVGVAPTHQRLGLGKGLLRALTDTGRGLGCREAWVLTERENGVAKRLYSSIGGVEDDKAVGFSFRLHKAGADPGSEGDISP